MKLTNSTLVAIYNARADRNLSCVLLQNIAADIREEINLVDISAKYNVNSTFGNADSDLAVTSHHERLTAKTVLTPPFGKGRVA